MQVLLAYGACLKCELKSSVWGGTGVTDCDSHGRCALCSTNGPNHLWAAHGHHRLLERHTGDCPFLFLCSCLLASLVVHAWCLESLVNKAWHTAGLLPAFLQLTVFTFAKFVLYLSRLGWVGIPACPLQLGPISARFAKSVRNGIDHICICLVYVCLTAANCGLS